MHALVRAVSVVILSILSYSAVNAQCRFSPTSIGRTVTYRFRSEITSHSSVLHVTLEFSVGPKGVDTLVLPTEWAGEPLRGLSYLHTTSSATDLFYSIDRGTATVRARPHQPVVIAYDLEKDWRGPLVAPLQFHAVIMPQYFEFTGSNALVSLKLDHDARETANFDWQQLPASWAIATSFGAGTSSEDRCQTFTGSHEDINQSLYAAGDFRLHPFLIGTKPAVLAIRSTWVFSDDEAVAEIQKTVGLVRGFWHDDNFPYFLVTLKPYDQDHGSSDGSAFTNAFWMYVSRRDNLKSLLPQLTHESFHAWDPGRMGSLSPDDYNETKWFKEGFTEYYAQLLTYKAGELSASSYIDGLNKDLQLFPTSTSEYVRGRIIALWLDAAIRADSNGKSSLDNVMHDMVAGSKFPYTQDRIFSTTDHYLSNTSQQQQLRHAVVNNGDLPAPPKVPALENCATATLDDIAPYDIGLDFDTTHSSGVISGVKEGGPAFAAGLRNGQTYLSSSFYKENPDHEAVFTVGAEKQKISYFPRGKTVKTWQYHLDLAQPCKPAP